MRCGRCGNENTGTNRFCGMCGAPLVPQSQAGGPPGAQTPSVPAENAGAPRSAFPAQTQPVARLAAPASASGAVDRGPVLSSFDVARDDEPAREPIISGPSFLGLNKPAARRAGVHADSGRDQLRSSGNVDYLLDDEDEPKRGWGKIVLVLLALILAGGFGYLRWRQGGFDWLKAGNRKPAATQVSPEAGQSGTDNSGSAGTAAAPAQTPAGAGPPPAGANSAAGGTAASPAGNTTAAPETPAASATASQNPPAATPPADNASANNAVQNNPPAPAQVAGSPNKLPNNASAAGATADPASRAADSDSQAQSNDSDSDEEQPTAAKAGARKAAATKPLAAKPSAARPVDTVADAERYIYGSGVRQDCDHGLRMLKTAAGRSDAKAMISLGALYSTGTCAPRDLPTAYRWFALALHKQPDNQALQDDLQKLWSQMTQPERQLAIKLSQ